MTRKDPGSESCYCWHCSDGLQQAEHVEEVGQQEDEQVGRQEGEDVDQQQQDVEQKEGERVLEYKRVATQLGVQRVGQG